MEPYWEQTPETLCFDHNQAGIPVEAGQAFRICQSDAKSGDGGRRTAGGFKTEDKQKEEKKRRGENYNNTNTSRRVASASRTFIPSKLRRKQK